MAFPALRENARIHYGRIEPAPRRHPAGIAA